MPEKNASPIAVRTEILRIRTGVLLIAAWWVCSGTAAGQGDPSDTGSRQGLRRAVAFFRSSAGVEGAYVHRVSADLSRRAGEEAVGPTTAWIEPPGTPAVGQAYLDAFEACGEPCLLEAAIETGRALVRGQLLSGGWGESIEFAANDRRGIAYRVDGGDAGTRENTTTFDDDKSQSCLRFLLALTACLDRERPTSPDATAIREAVTYALEGFARAQFPNGAWPQRWRGRRDDAPDLRPGPDGEFPRARIPDDWPRTWPKAKYADLYTLNDGLMADMITTFLAAHTATGDDRWLAVARRGGDFLVRAQMPEPQPAWAQQYDRAMQPTWARRFEPPAVSGGESQGILVALIRLARHTGDDRYLAPVRPALDYLRRSRLPDGQLARFYELGTNRPLYMNRRYEITYDDDDLPSHYGFTVSSKLDAIERDLARVHDPVKPPSPPDAAALGPQAARILASLDARGAWVEEASMPGAKGKLSVIDSATFIRNLRSLALHIQSCDGPK